MAGISDPEKLKLEILVNTETGEIGLTSGELGPDKKIEFFPLNDSQNDFSMESGRLVIRRSLVCPTQDTLERLQPIADERIFDQIWLEKQTEDQLKGKKLREFLRITQNMKQNLQAEKAQSTSLRRERDEARRESAHSRRELDILENRYDRLNEIYEEHELDHQTAINELKENKKILIREKQKLLSDRSKERQSFNERESQLKSAFSQETEQKNLLLKQVADLSNEKYVIEQHVEQLQSSLQKQKEAFVKQETDLRKSLQEQIDRNASLVDQQQKDIEVLKRGFETELRNAIAKTKTDYDQQLQHTEVLHRSQISQMKEKKRKIEEMLQTLNSVVFS